MEFYDDGSSEMRPAWRRPKSLLVVPNKKCPPGHSWDGRKCRQVFHFGNKNQTNKATPQFNTFLRKLFPFFYEDV
ncbi:unnamed protein product [Allacma fusca]|uniref:Uncharacterized protein n=1 Tax=Allacma fusca TaxID=39272 RepID=A0A8J2NX24_9HEXA|nr:unnamed protein product [Allacma fusca]